MPKKILKFTVGIFAIAAILLPQITFAATASVLVQVWGAGGSGARSSAGFGVTGGAGGAYSDNPAYTVTSGVAYSVSIGAGGPPATVNATAGTTGGDSYFNTASDVMAKGGEQGKLYVSGTVTSSGGAAGSGFGTNKFSGGNSVLSSIGINGGGGSAGSAGNGGNASPGAGTGGSAGSPDGAAGGSGNNPGGNSGGFPGGGGGGANSGSNSGAGNSGKVIVRALLGVVASATGGTHTTDATYDYWTFTSNDTWTPTIVPPVYPNASIFTILNGAKLTILNGATLIIQ